jgi:hypothetical protein
VDKPLPKDENDPIRAAQWTLHQPASGHRRIACNEQCELEFGERHRDAIIWNLSDLGVYVIGDTLPAVGETVHISFSLPGDAAPIHCEARCIWQNPPSIFKGCGALARGLPPGCGLEFVALADDARRRIRDRIKATVLSVG